MPSERRIVVAIVGVLAALAICAPGAKGAAADSFRPNPFVSDLDYQQLDALASHWARYQVRVSCAPDWPTWQQDQDGDGTYAYTWLDADWTRVEPDICPNAVRGASELAPLEQEDVAVAILIITHESWHLRLWRWRRDEGRVECKAIQHFSASVRLLGVTDPARIAQLYSYAWAFDVREGTLFPAYHWRGCRRAKPTPDWLRQ